MSTLIPRQRDVLDFIERFVEKKRYSPSFLEIANGLKLKSLATVHKHLTSLQNKGFLNRAVNKARSMEVTEPDTLNARFRFEGKDRLWDNVDGCFGVKEKD